MSRHRSRPTPRHRKEPVRGRSYPARPQAGHAGVVVRRVVVTPTFAAGLGIVIAAGLAYPMSGTVFHYAAPDQGTPCAVEGCLTHGWGSGPGSLASARPGQRLRNTTPHPPATSGPQPSGPRGGSPQPGPRQSPRGGLVATYQTLRQGQGVFIGRLWLPLPPGGGARWRLEFGYPSGRILSVWGGTASQLGSRSVLVTPWEYGGQQGQGVSVVFVVAGQAGPPAQCTFDGKACQVSVVGGQQPPGEGSLPGGVPRPGGSSQPGAGH